MNNSARTIFPALLVLLASAASSALAVSSPQMTVPMIAQAPVIDGHVTPEEQANAREVSLQKVASLAKPQYPTKVYVAATMQGLYVGFIADEPAVDKPVAATKTENGPVFNDDSLQILITPTFDTAADAYYHFAVNPAGTRYSNHIIAREPVTGWQSAVSKKAGKNGQSGHWEAEFFIPLKSIDAPDELPVWRANFARYRAAREDQPAETTAWVDPGISLHNYKKFGYLTMPRFVPDAPGAPTTSSEPANTTQTIPMATIPSADVTSMPVSTTP